MLIEMMGWVENVSTLPKLRKRHICIKRLYADGNQTNVLRKSKEHHAFPMLTAGTKLTFYLLGRHSTQKFSSSPHICCLSYSMECVDSLNKRPMLQHVAQPSKCDVKHKLLAQITQETSVQYTNQDVMSKCTCRDFQHVDMSHIFCIDILSEWKMSKILSTFSITAEPLPIAYLAGLSLAVSSQSGSSS